MSIRQAKSEGVGRAVTRGDLQTQGEDAILAGSETGPASETQKKGQGRVMHLPEGTNPKPVGE